MSRPDSKGDGGDASRRAEAEAAAANKRRDDTLTRIRSALIEDRLAVMDLNGDNTGTDPYNSGVHRAMTKAHVWSKRSR